MKNSPLSSKREKYNLKVIAYYLLMIIFTLSVCFFIAEYTFARYYYSNVSNIKNKEFDSEIGWVYLPGKYMIKPMHSLKMHEIYINKYGLRNKEVNTNNGINVKRVVVLGDSFTFANAIRDEDIFTTKMENILNENKSEHYEVINAGVEGYGNIQELLLMRRLMDNNIVGDVYLLMIFINDILDNLCYSYGDNTENYVQPKYIIGDNNRLILSRLPKKEIDESANFMPVTKESNKFKIIDVLKIKIASYLQTRPNMILYFSKVGYNVKFPRVPGLINGWYEENKLKDGLPILKEAIREIKYEASKNNALLIVSLIPSPLQVYPEVYGPILKRTFQGNILVEKWLSDKLLPQRSIKEICEELNIPYLDLYKDLRDNNDKELYIPNEGHFNEKGHRVAAESLAKYIKYQTHR